MSYSIQDLLKTGITKEQFISKFDEIKNSGADSSIFTSGLDIAAGEMFDILNTNENNEIDENEINELAAFYDDKDNNSTISENDLKILYNKIFNEIDLNTPSASSEDMYDAALKKNDGDIYSLSYVENLSTQINILKNLISARQKNSINIINLYQSKIDDLVLKSTKLSNEFKSDFKTASEKLKKLQIENNKNEEAIQAKNQEIERNRTEADIINQEISKLSSKTDQDKIKSRQNELANLDSEYKVLADDYEGFISKRESYSSDISKTEIYLKKLTNYAKEQDSTLENKITEFENKAEFEKTDTKNDINKYKEKIEVLEKAKAYSITKISPMGASIDKSSFKKNDNLLNFSELESSGLKYSSEKGQKLAQTVSENVVGFTGYCSRYVSNALQESGLGNERAASANLMDTKLSNNSNFKAVKINSQDELKSLPAGCIVVYEAGAAGYSSKYGHIEVTLGNGTAASDGITKNMRYSENMTVFVPVENA